VKPVSPDGMNLNVRSAWHINPGSAAPRFVILAPCHEENVDVDSADSADGMDERIEACLSREN
jgi:hypothetical protein